MTPYYIIEHPARGVLMDTGRFSWASGRNKGLRFASAADAFARLPNLPLTTCVMRSPSEFGGDWTRVDDRLPPMTPSLPPYRVEYICEEWSLPYSTEDDIAPGDVLDLGGWDDVGGFLEGVVPGRYRFHVVGADDYFDVLTGAVTGLRCVEGSS